MGFYPTEQLPGDSLENSSNPHTPYRGLQLSGLRYYSLELGRWVNRDPIEERRIDPRFRTTSLTPSLAQPNQALYVYVENSPVDLVDSLGLTVYVCTRPSQPPLPGRHAYLWDSSTKKCCARQGGSSGGGAGSCPKSDKGPAVHECVAIAGSEADNGKLIQCCELTANTGPWAPFINDCHNSVNRCLINGGYDIPPHPRFPVVPPEEGGCCGHVLWVF